MASGRHITPFSRDYRRPPKWGMGLPPRKKPRRGRAILKWATIAVLAAAFLPPVVDTANGYLKPTIGCRILRVVDGDTVRLNCPVSGRQTGRVIGYDAPELFSPRCSSELMKAVAAMSYLRWQLWSAGSIQAQTEGTDQHGRALTLLLTNGEGVARRMVQAGLARWYDGGPRQGWCADA